MNSQREAIYSQRQELLRSEDLDPELRDMVADTIENVLAAWESTGTYEETRDFDGLVRNAKNVLNVDLGPEHKSLSRDELEELLVERTSAILERKRAELGDETWRRLVKVILLRTLDEQWKDHLTNMHNLEEGIGLRAYGQKDPLVEYRIEGAEMFQAMIDTVKERVTEFLLRVDMVKTEDEKLELKAPDVFYTNRDEGGPAPREVRKRAIDKVSRNAPCPCGSGRKFKQCCGA